MSDPLQQQQQQQQPVLVYPNSVNEQQPQPQTLSHSKGSFETSFIVLAVIIVLSGATCLLSRLCNKRGQKKQKEPKQDKNHKPKKGQGGGPLYPIHPTFPPQQSRRKEMDMEFGFGARVGPVPGQGFHQQQFKGNDIEIGYHKKSRQSKGSGDIDMGFDSGKGAPNVDTMRGQKPYHHNGVMNGETNPHFNGRGWRGGQ